MTLEQNKFEKPELKQTERDYLYKILVEAFSLGAKVEKKQFCEIYNISERHFRDIVSEISRTLLPIVALSNSRGYWCPVITRTSKESDIRKMMEAVRHQLNEYESRIKYLNQRCSLLEEWLDQAEERIQ